MLGAHRHPWLLSGGGLPAATTPTRLSRPSLAPRPARALVNGRTSVSASRSLSHGGFAKPSPVVKRAMHLRRAARTPRCVPSAAAATGNALHVQGPAMRQASGDALAAGPPEPPTCSTPQSAQDRALRLVRDLHDGSHVTASLANEVLRGEPVVTPPSSSCAVL